MTSYISPDRRGEGESLHRELAATRAVQPGPAHPQPPSPPVRRKVPPRTSWRWLVAGGAAISLFVGTWAIGHDSRVGRRPPPDRTPLAMVTAVGGNVSLRAGTGLGWIDATRGLTLMAGADVRTTGSGALDLRTADGAEIHVDANSRIQWRPDGPVRVDFGRIVVDTRHVSANDARTEFVLPITDTRIRGERALFVVRAFVPGAEIEVREGRVAIDDREWLEAGDCLVIHDFRRGLPSSTGTGPCR